jgi:hypothetical protein
VCSSDLAAITYSSFLEAMLVLARLPHDAAALRLLSRGCAAAASLLSASNPPERYTLATPAVAS